MRCTKMVATQPPVGATDRHPPDHQCGRAAWKDGLCKTHHPQHIAAEVERKRLRLQKYIVIKEEEVIELREPSCDKCRFYNEYDDGEGSCYRFPPVFVGAPGNSANIDYWDLPSTHGSWWCGEWKKRLDSV